MTTSMNTDLSGKRAIVTGASRGIGEAIARRLASAGARVALASRKLEGLEAVGKSIETETMIVQANMSRSEDVAAIVPAVVEAWGGVDILINNAGTNPVFGPILETEERAWDKTFDINVKGPFLLSQAAAAEMDKAGGGAIVNIASTGGLEPSPMLGAYSVSKAAIIMLTKGCLNIDTPWFNTLCDWNPYGFFTECWGECLCVIMRHVIKGTTNRPVRNEPLYSFL